MKTERFVAFTNDEGIVEACIMMRLTVSMQPAIFERVKDKVFDLRWSGSRKGGPAQPAAFYETDNTAGLITQVILSSIYSSSKPAAASALRNPQQHL